MLTVARPVETIEEFAQYYDPFMRGELEYKDLRAQINAKPEFAQSVVNALLTAPNPADYLANKDPKAAVAVLAGLTTAISMVIEQTHPDNLVIEGDHLSSLAYEFNKSAAAATEEILTTHPESEIKPLLGYLYLRAAEQARKMADLYGDSEAEAIAWQEAAVTQRENCVSVCEERDDKNKFKDLFYAKLHSADEKMKLAALYAGNGREALPTLEMSVAGQCELVEATLIRIAHSGTIDKKLAGKNYHTAAAPKVRESYEALESVFSRNGEANRIAFRKAFPEGDLINTLPRWLMREISAALPNPIIKGNLRIAHPEIPYADRSIAHIIEREYATLVMAQKTLVARFGAESAQAQTPGIIVPLAQQLGVEESGEKLAAARIAKLALAA